MTRYFRPLVLIVATVGASCSEPQEVLQTSSPEVASQSADDVAVLSVVLRDFSEWKEVTFGERVGILALDPFSKELPSQTILDVRQLVKPISDAVSDELIVAFLERNRSRATIAPLVAVSPWARIDISAQDDESFDKLPDWAKATGVLTLPGFSADRTQALIQIRHSWSIHSAVVTYLLSIHDGTWRIQTKDQAVFP